MTARKRFYKTVTVTDDDGGLVVRLDDRVVKSPAGANAILPSRELADAVATEWDSQGEEIDAARRGGSCRLLALLPCPTCRWRKHVMLRHSVRAL